MDISNTTKTKMLIISNNVLSNTNNNGKTVLSFIKGIEKERIRQLYFHSEKPSVKGYSYYQLSDFDIIRGFFEPSKRGRVWKDDMLDAGVVSNANITHKKQRLKKTSFLRLIRDLLWCGHWKSRALMEWLDEYQPDTVFFVAGDSGFAYNITKIIVKRYNARLVTYITDDYIMPRAKESFIDFAKRLVIRRKMIACINSSDAYFTISELMRKTYASITGKDSEIIMNMTPSLYDPRYDSHNNENIVMVYAGSLYYGRDTILGKIADVALHYNSKIVSDNKKVEIRVYSNSTPTDESRAVFERDGCCTYCGSLSPDELKVVLNCSDVLLFVESFDSEMQEKTKYSLSTKVPEYMSVRKPIFAIGPEGIGSIDYLSDVAFCAFCENKIEDELMKLVSCPKEVSKKVMMSTAKYYSLHNIDYKKERFFNICFKEEK